MAEQAAIGFALSDQGEFGALLKWVGEVGAQTTVVPGVPAEGEQGALDSLLMTGGGAALLAAVRMLPEFIRSRRSNVSLTMIVKGEEVTLTADNVPDVLQIVERLLGE
jgi:hypothetical protein